MSVVAGPLAAERAYTYTKSQIITGRLAGGRLVSEAAIGAELGISRTPVHEAFLRLASERLLELASRKGAIVRPMTPSEVADVLAMRVGIESASAAQVFDAGGPAPRIMELLSRNLDDQARCVAAEDVSGFVELDDEFHALMVEASGNSVAQHFYEMLRDRQQRLRNLLLRVDISNLASAYGDHRRLFECFTVGDRVGFTDALDAHMKRYQGAL